MKRHHQITLQPGVQSAKEQPFTPIGDEWIILDHKHQVYRTGGMFGDNLVSGRVDKDPDVEIPINSPCLGVRFV
jgi:hypothetical protein